MRPKPSRWPSSGIDCSLLSDAPSDSNDLTFGARFMVAWRECGGLYSDFKDAQIRSLKAGGREASLEVLAPALSKLPAVERKELRSDTPERVALTQWKALANRRIRRARTFNVAAVGIWLLGN